MFLSARIKTQTHSQGGDEFCVILKTKDDAQYIKLYQFYSEWKAAINNLVKCEFMKKYKAEIELLSKGKDLETIAVLKDRKIKKILAEMSGIEIDKDIKQRIAESVIAHNMSFAVDKIGISVGLYVPMGGTKDRNWIESAEKAQSIAKGLKGKNEICVYYEKINGVIPSEKTEACLKKGCYWGLTGQEMEQYKKANENVLQ